MGRTVEYIKIVEEDLRRGCRTKTALPYGRDSCIAWNRCQKLFLFPLSVAKQADSAENAQKKSVAVTVVRPLL